MTETTFATLPNGREVAFRQISGSPGPTFVHAPGGMVPIEVIEDDPVYDRFLRVLGAYGRLMVFDTPGKGASDPLDPAQDFVDQIADSFVAVLDASGVDSAWLVVGNHLGAPVVRRVSIRHRQRLSGAAVLNPPGERRLQVDELIERGAEAHDRVLRAWIPSRADDPEFRAWHERAGRLGGSATAARALNAAGERSVQGIRSDTAELEDPPPFLILHRRDREPESVITWWSRRLPGAEVVVLEGADGPFNSGDSVVVADAIGAFATGERRSVLADRVLVGLLFVDLVASTEALARAGDVAWSAVLDFYENTVERSVVRHGGSTVKHIGDGTLATFPTGSRAIGAAVSIRAALAERGFEARLAIHVGEVELRNEDVSGLAVNLTARVLDSASPGQILVTGTAVGSVSGSAYLFEGVGRREFKGFDEDHELHSLRTTDHSAPDSG